jgi:putative hydrolase of the HAD superfamily
MSNSIKMGILSNSMFSSKTISQDLERHKMKSYFDFVITSSEYGIRKPNKLLFEIAIKKLNIEANEIWFIGDSLNEDIIGSKNAGMFPVWYNTKSYNKKNVTEYLEINSWGELVQILESLKNKS